MINKQDITEHIAEVLFEHFTNQGSSIMYYPPFDLKRFDRTYILDHDFFHNLCNHYEDDLHAGLGNDYDTIFCQWMEKLVDGLWETGVERFEEMKAEWEREQWESDMIRTDPFKYYGVSKKDFYGVR